MKAEKLYSWDTVLSADSVEFCPYDSLSNVFAVGTYQVDKSKEETFSPDQRQGRIYLLQHEQSQPQVKDDIKVKQGIFHLFLEHMSRLFFFFF